MLGQKLKENLGVTLALFSNFWSNFFFVEFSMFSGWNSLRETKKDYYCRFLLAPSI